MKRTRTGSDPARRASAAWLLIPGSAVLLALLLNLFVVVFAYVSLQDQASQFFPATIRTESLTDCPERLVPAARNVTGTE